MICAANVRCAMMAARDVDPAARVKMEAAVVERDAALMRLGERMLEIDDAVGLASLRPA